MEKRTKQFHQFFQNWFWAFFPGHYKNEQANVDHVVFSDEIRGYFRCDVPLPQVHIGWEPSHGFRLIQRDVEAVKLGGLGQFAGEIREPNPTRVAILSFNRNR